MNRLCTATLRIFAKKWECCIKGRWRSPVYFFQTMKFTYRKRILVKIIAKFDLKNLKIIKENSCACIYNLG